MNEDLYEHIKKLYPVLDKEDKFMYFHNYKAAYTSIGKDVLVNRSILFDFHSDWYSEKLNSYSPESIENNLFKFTIVRNPWAKAVSSFFYIKYIHKYIDKSIDFNSFIKGTLYNKREELIYHSREGFMDTPEVFTLAHFNKQYDRAYYDGNMFIDFVAKIENIEDDWKYINSIIGVNEEVPQSNMMPDVEEYSRDKFYTHYYDNDAVDIIYEIYEKDIVTFNYEFGL